MAIRSPINSWNYNHCPQNTTTQVDADVFIPVYFDAGNSQRENPLHA